MDHQQRVNELQQQTKDANRRRFLKAFKRADLEKLVDQECRPWAMDVSTLIAHIVSTWDDEIKDELIDKLQDSL